ncbi:hypothetical protein G5B38_01095 [Pseudohalocynthiibacter aestuariivivens]|uniref:DoxX protein n=1 Tax=Roseovarius pelagicus TaxID=2980108 RepID=A0ABY6DCJ2_9RHOB|nr:MULTISPECIES: hypothetical protein [Rhodobacterales]QIE44237.1 hypothetical protein G5B38_01095 [Pseudohalocynthiibacter aestuariivivens]UXX83862.1 hypothetical protein N7U68_04165 [Roseovarius pelagicus]
MTQHDEAWFNQTGRNLIRIVIGSYFAAVALDFSAGVDPAALFAPVMPYAVADLVGSSLLLAAAIGYVLGAGLRLSALSLAVFVISSTLVQNFVSFSPSNISGFWRDLAMVCAVLSAYANQTNRNEIAVITPRPRPIRPRRISIAARTDRPEVIQPEVASPEAPLIFSHHTSGRSPARKIGIAG